MKLKTKQDLYGLGLKIKTIIAVIDKEDYTTKAIFNNYSKLIIDGLSHEESNIIFYSENIEEAKKKEKEILLELKIKLEQYRESEKLIKQLLTETEVSL